MNRYAIAAEALVALNEWIDTAPANAVRDPEARTWGRLAKVVEEHGEVLDALIAANGAACGRVIAAYIGATGQNPRKGTTGDMDAVRKELLDVALTALCAVEHLDGGAGRSLDALSDHIAWVRERALGPADPVCPTCGPTTVEPHPRRSVAERCANCKTPLGGPDGDSEMADVLAVAFETDGNGCDHGEPACSNCLARVALLTIREGRAV